MKRKHIIALTGGAGSGKSRILEILKEKYSAAVLQTDQVARDLEEPGQPGFEALVKEFGEEILDGTGRLHKAAMVRLIFEDDKAREKVNSLIHPLVWEEVKRWCRQVQEGTAVVESALLPAEPHKLFEEVWYVHSSIENRTERMIENRGYSRKRCRQMAAGQPKEEEYRQNADRVIDNDGTKEELTVQIQALMDQVSLAEAGGVYKIRKKELKQ